MSQTTVNRTLHQNAKVIILLTVTLVSEVKDILLSSSVSCHKITYFSVGSFFLVCSFRGIYHTTRDFCQVSEKVVVALIVIGE